MSLNGKICGSCCVELRPLKNDVRVVEMAIHGPMAIWCADLWHCPNCGDTTILGFGANPIAQDFEDKDKFARMLKAVEAEPYCYHVFLNESEHEAHNATLPKLAEAK